MKHIILCLFACVAISCAAQQTSSNKTDTAPILAGAERMNVYLPLLKGKRVGIFANQTSMVGKTHLVDTLQKSGITIKVIFGPEHGFRGTADAGEKIGNYVDEQTGIAVVSLYGSKRRPSPEDVKDVDILIFDIQDVGVRFYTFISSLEEFINAAFEYGKPLLVLDRPNPNGFYVYGMTIGEYAMMLSGESWLNEKANTRAEYYKRAQNSPPDTMFHFLVIKCENYTHKSNYVLPVTPP